MTSSVSATGNVLGFGIDNGETAITFMHNDDTGLATKDTITGQPTVASGQGYDLYIYCKPNDTTVYYRMDDLNLNKTIANGSTASNLPINTTMMSVFAVGSNGTNTPVSAFAIGVNNLYIETNR